MKSVFYHKGIPYSFDKVRKQMHSNYARIMPAVAEIAVNFFQARFRAEAWTDRSAKRWAQRKNKDKNKNKRGILIKSGQLRNAIRPDLYPYLEYMPSTAGTPRSEHKKLYGVIKALDDPFWDTWLPPADWGCKCSVQQRRSDKGTNQPPEEIKLPPQAMRNNPGKDGQIFTNKHPMISRVGKKERKLIEDETGKLENRIRREDALKFAKSNIIGKKLKTKDGLLVAVSKGSIDKMNSQGSQDYITDLPDILSKMEVSKLPELPTKGKRNIELTHFYQYQLKNLLFNAVVWEMKGKSKTFILHAFNVKK
ncbi:hypothetical protein EOM75_08930 [Candidatus Falkowbacteria bacterium]|nr:hypothetical protein [Candidatus Falkowbacteria bacterium]